MEYRLVIICTLAFIAQISCQCLNKGLQAGGIKGLSGLGLGGGRAFGSNLGGKPFGRGVLGRPSGAGGRFAVTSASPVPPTGVSVLTDTLSIEGPVDVGGNLPFKGSVAVEGKMSNSGSASVSYGCGSGNVGITDTTAGPGSTPINLSRSVAPGLSGFSPSGCGLLGSGVSSLASGLNGFGSLGGFLV